MLGEVFGALFFGRLSDALGLKNLFILTLGVYLGGNALTAFAWDNSAGSMAFIYLTRFIAGAGIGGEYAAINSAIDEMMPARYRGRVDIGVNGTYWGGAILGTLGTFVLLNQLSPDLGWRLGFLIGPILGAAIWGLRRHLPESPRWLIMHGREAERRRTSRSSSARSRRPGSGWLPSTRARPSRSSRARTTATSRWSRCCSVSTPGGRCSARP